MMQVSDAQKLAETRGVDIDPENCWHDWQNLRAELGRTPALPPGPRFNQLHDSDLELQKSVRGAQSSLHELRKLIVASKESGAMPLIKTRLVDGDAKAFMWLSNVHEMDGGFSGELFEVPSNFENYQPGDRLEVPDGSILDWMVNDQGNLYGGYSIRLIRSRKPADEQAQYDDYIGVTNYMPLGPSD